MKKGKTETAFSWERKIKSVKCVAVPQSPPLGQSSTFTVSDPLPPTKGVSSLLPAQTVEPVIMIMTIIIIMMMIIFCWKGPSFSHTNSGHTTTHQRLSVSLLRWMLGLNQFECGRYIRSPTSARRGWIGQENNRKDRARKIAKGE